MPPSDALAAWVAGQRWFAGKTRRIVGVETEDRIAVGTATLTLVRVRLDGGGDDRYAIPLAPGADIADALDDGAYAPALFALIRGGGRLGGEHGELVGVPTRACPADAGPLAARRLGGEQSNTSVALGDVALLKHFRRVAAGPHPDQEVTGFLTERTAFAHAPRLYGHLEYRAADGNTIVLAVAHELVRDAEDGWAWTLAEARRALAGERAAEPGLAALERLGAVTAELHVALASGAHEPAFVPEPVGPADVARWTDAVRRQLDAARAALRGQRLPEVPDVAAGLGGLVGTVKTRHHGDYHLGQTLYRPASGAWMVIDFEGEPLRPIHERRQKHAPLRDVAGMLRSIDYAAVAVAAAPDDARARAWERAAAARFLTGYRRGASGAPFVPASEAAFTRAVAAFVVEKAAYEIVYEASHRPDWIRIPVEGLARAAGAITGARSAGAA
ncbi:MAG: sugar phosphotransferase [Candidatus Rokubacteria bacterium]|nr:sugar phosphotransferase [Candidatus Rokubacteria bacterium]